MLKQCRPCPLCQGLLQDNPNDLTSQLNPNLNYTLFGADPELNSDMFAAAELEVWEKLCVPITEPVAAIFDGGDTGCTGFPKSDKPFDIMNMDNDPCAVLTLLPFGLSSSFVEPYMNDQLISEAAVMAAWPHVNVKSLQSAENCIEAVRSNMIRHVASAPNDTAAAAECLNPFTYLVLVDNSTQSTDTSYIWQCRENTWLLGGDGGTKADTMKLCTFIPGFTRKNYEIKEPPDDSTVSKDPGALYDDMIALSNYYNDMRDILNGRQEDPTATLKTPPKHPKEALSKLPTLLSDTLGIDAPSKGLGQWFKTAPGAEYMPLKWFLWGHQGIVGYTTANCNPYGTPGKHGPLTSLITRSWSGYQFKDNGVQALSDTNWNNMGPIDSHFDGHPLEFFNFQGFTGSAYYGDYQGTGQWSNKAPEVANWFQCFDSGAWNLPQSNNKFFEYDVNATAFVNDNICWSTLASAEMSSLFWGKYNEGYNSILTASQPGLSEGVFFKEGTDGMPRIPMADYSGTYAWYRVHNKVFSSFEDFPFRYSGFPSNEPNGKYHFPVVDETFVYAFPTGNGPFMQLPINPAFSDIVRGCLCLDLNSSRDENSPRSAMIKKWQNAFHEYWAFDSKKAANVSLDPNKACNHSDTLEMLINREGNGFTRVPVTLVDPNFYVANFGKDNWGLQLQLGANMGHNFYVALEENINWENPIVYPEYPWTKGQRPMTQDATRGFKTIDPTAPIPQEPNICYLGPADNYPFTYVPDMNYDINLTNLNYASFSDNVISLIVPQTINPGYAKAAQIKPFNIIFDVYQNQSEFKFIQGGDATTGEISVLEWIFGNVSSVRNLRGLPTPFLANYFFNNSQVQIYYNNSLDDLVTNGTIRTISTTNARQLGAVFFDKIIKTTASSSFKSPCSKAFNILSNHTFGWGMFEVELLMEMEPAGSALAWDVAPVGTLGRETPTFLSNQHFTQDWGFDVNKTYDQLFPQDYSALWNAAPVGSRYRPAQFLLVGNSSFRWFNQGNQVLPTGGNPKDYKKFAQAANLEEVFRNNGKTFGSENLRHLGLTSILAHIRVGHMAAGRAAPYATSAWMMDGEPSKYAAFVASCAEMSNSYHNYNFRVMPDWGEKDGGAGPGDQASKWANTVKCINNTECSPLNDNRIKYVNGDPTRPYRYGQVPHMKRRIRGPTVWNVKLETGEDNFLSKNLFTNQEMWKRFEDYSTLRVDGSVNFDGVFDSLMVSNPDYDWRPTTGELPFANRHNRFMNYFGIKKAAMFYATRNRQLIYSPDPLTQNGMCFPSYNHTGGDMYANGLYRRRHFTYVDPLKDDYVFVSSDNIALGMLPRFVGDHVETELLRKYREEAQPVKPGQTAHQYFKDDDAHWPPPPPPKCTTVWCKIRDGFEEVGDIVLAPIEFVAKQIIPRKWENAIDNEIRKIPYVGHVVANALANLGFGAPDLCDGTDFYSQLLITAFDPLYAANVDPKKAIANSNCAVNNDKVTRLNPIPPVNVRDAFTWTNEVIDDDPLPTTLDDMRRKVIWERTMPNTLFTPDEQALFTEFLNLANLPDDSPLKTDGRMLIGVSGQKVFITPKDEAEDPSVTISNHPTWKYEANKLFSEPAFPDGVDYFTAATIPFPAVWRVITRNRNVEKPEVANPFSGKPQYTADGIKKFCQGLADCNHRACNLTEAGCVALSVPNCTWSPGDSRECSDPVFPVCVKVFAEEYEGMPLTEDGSLKWALSTLDPSCVPITHKTLLDESTIEKLYYNGSIWRPECAFGEGDRSLCDTVPTTLDEVINQTNIKMNSNLALLSAPYSFFSSSPGQPLNWVGVTDPLDGSFRADIEKISTEVANLASGSSVEEGYRIADRNVIPSGPTCKEGANCGLLIDFLQHVNCPRVLQEHQWPGTCIKPSFQIITPDYYYSQAEPSLLTNVFSSEATYVPQSTECPAYEPVSQSIQPSFAFRWPNIRNLTQERPFYGANRDNLAMVHYCDYSAMGRITYCDNDALSYEQRADLCENYGGSLAYDGWMINQLSYSNVCDPIEKRCYLLPGDAGVGTLSLLYAAIKDNDPNPDGYTIIVLPFTSEVFNSLLLSPMMYKTDITNDWSQNCTGTASPICGPCELERWGDKMLTSQGLGLNAYVLSEQFCLQGNGFANDNKTIDMIYNLRNHWAPATENGVKGYKVITSRDTGLYDSYTFIPETAFSCTSDESGKLLVDTPGLTIKAFPDHVFTLHNLNIEVAADTFTIENVVMGTSQSPAIEFSGASAQSSTLINIRTTQGSLASPMVTAAFYGAATDFTEYAPAINVDGTTLTNVSGYVAAGFARAIGNVRVDGVMETMDEPLIPPSCNRWGYAYSFNKTNNVPAEWAQDLIWDLQESVLVATDSTGTLRTLVVNDIVPRFHGGYLVDINSMSCVVVVGNKLTLGDCTTKFTRHMHVEGNPFFCVSWVDDEFFYLPCSPCRIGLGYVDSSKQYCQNNASAQTYQAGDKLCNGTTCSLCGLSRATTNCDFPVGHAIVSCSADPSGAVTSFNCNGKTGSFVPIKEKYGSGAYYNCLTDTVVVGGYGYRPSTDVVVQQVLIQPEMAIGNTFVAHQGARVINVTEYTTIFGEAFERDLFHSSVSTSPLSRVLATILLLVIVFEFLLHVLLEYYRLRTYRALKSYLNR